MSAVPQSHTLTFKHSDCRSSSWARTRWLRLHQWLSIKNTVPHLRHSKSHEHMSLVSHQEQANSWNKKKKFLQNILLLKLPISCQKWQGVRNLNYWSHSDASRGQMTYLLGNDCWRSRFSPGTCLWLAWQLLLPPGTSLQTEHMEQLLGLTLILFVAISSTYLYYFVSTLSL